MAEQVGDAKRQTKQVKGYARRKDSQANEGNWSAALWERKAKARAESQSYYVGYYG